MGRSNRTSTTAVLIVCLLGTQWTYATVFASDEQAASGATQPVRPTVTGPLETHRATGHRPLAV